MTIRPQPWFRAMFCSRPANLASNRVRRSSSFSTTPATLSPLQLCGFSPQKSSEHRVCSSAPDLRSGRLLQPRLLAKAPYQKTMAWRRRPWRFTSLHHHEVGTGLSPHELLHLPSRLPLHNRWLCSISCLMYRVTFRSSPQSLSASRSLPPCSASSRLVWR